MGSVKDLQLLDPAYENRPGEGNFHFSDRYSVFDWGEMPDQIAGKGAALAVMSAYNFEELERRGIRTHYRGLVTANGGLVRFADLKKNGGGCETMRVALARVYHPTARSFLGAGENPEVRYDYAFFKTNRGRLNNFLVPLEVIFRNALPLGSSVFAMIARIEAAAPEGAREAALRELLSALGLEQVPVPGQMLPRPVMSFSTKLESGDRNLEEREAFEISGLEEADFQELTAIGLAVNEFISERAESCGLYHYDGKIELIYDGGLVLADVVGTFDENRFASRDRQGRQERQISKEFLRQWYKRHQSDFPPACEAAKAGGAGWQSRCPVKPVRLPAEMVRLTAQMYQAGCNRYTGRRLFDVPELEDVLEALEPYRR